jgi:Rrf2 family protein
MSSVIGITDKSRCAVDALTELARRADGSPTPIVDISEARDIPLHVLEQLFANLRRAGVLSSQRGVKGGYSFVHEPHQVTLLSVIEAVDGRLGLAEPGAGVDEVWDEARNALVTLFSRVTIQDMVEKQERMTQTPMFYI